MAWLLHAALLGLSALSALSADLPPPIPIELPCRKAVNDMRQHDEFQFAKLSLATGKSLPSDAGKYVMCMNQKNTRYFLVKMAASMPLKPNMSSMALQVGFCVPDVCDHAGVTDLVQSETVKYFLPQLDPEQNFLRVSHITTTSPQLDLKPVSVGGTLASVIVGLLVLLVLVSTTIVIAKQARPQELPLHQQPGQQLLQDAAPRQPPRQPLIIEAFSLVGKSGTLRKLVEIPPYKPTDSLNGLRVVSMAWIILGHTFLEPMGISGYMNMEDIKMTPLNSDVAENNPWLSFIMSAQAGVDSFFFLSGFLLSYLTLKELRQGKMKVVAAVILRYIRLTPSLALAMLIYYQIWQYFGFGPFAANFQDSVTRRCDGSWWSELTYTMNFVPFDSDKVCMGWTWYLGDDMIFFVISILILPLYYKKRWLGWVSVLTLSGLSFGVTAWLVIKYKLGVYIFDDEYKRYSYYAYSKPYTRIPAYFVGLVSAWLLDEMELRGITRETRPFTRSAKMAATVAAALSGAVLVFLTFVSATDFGDSKESWSLLTSVLYIDFSRPAWAMCLAVLTLLCYYDFLPLLNGFMAHPYWTPLARLTYGAYLVHPLMIKLAAGRSLQFYTFNAWDLTYRFMGNAIMAYSGSVVLWVLMERPCMTIFSPAQKPRSKKANSSSDSRNDSIPDMSKVSVGSSSNPDLPPDVAKLIQGMRDESSGRQ